MFNVARKLWYPCFLAVGVDVVISQQVVGLANSVKKILPSKLSWAMPQNYVILQETFSLGRKVVTALHHAKGIACVSHAALISSN